MSVGRNGLRHVGGTNITKCCGREAMPPVDRDETDDRWIHETDDGVPVTEAEFPDADLVCTECGRTWGDGCEHDVDQISLLASSTIELDEHGHAWTRGYCSACNEDVHVLLEVTDVRDIDA